MDILEATPRLETLTDRIRRSLLVLWRCIEVMESCSGGVAAPSTRGPGPLHDSHPCMRCGAPTDALWNCAECEAQR